MKFLYLSTKHYSRFNLGQYPSTGYKGNVTGMRKQYWGEEAKIVQCGNFYYHVPEEVFTKILNFKKTFKL